MHRSSLVPRPSTLRFVVQEHHARNWHHDFRLEHDGVLKSWVVPKGVPEEFGVRRLALETEDHALEFADFEGEIPQGEYGAGTIAIWDRGGFDLKEWNDDEIHVVLDGDRLRGNYSLIRFPEGGPRAWLLVRRRSEASRLRQS